VDELHRFTDKTITLTINGSRVVAQERASGLVEELVVHHLNKLKKYHPLPRVDIASRIENWSVSTHESLRMSGRENAVRKRREAIEQAIGNICADDIPDHPMRKNILYATAEALSYPILRIVKPSEIEVTEKWAIVCIYRKKERKKDT
jgi:hypothetical protein